MVSVGDLTTGEINVVLDTAQRLGSRPSEVLRGRQVALLFYETSTRTRNSFLTAVHQLGATVCGFDSQEGTSVAKGETLQDTIRMFEAYADAIVLRHPRDGAARWAADISRVPVINAGDGKNQHPTQTLLDLLAIRTTQGRLRGLKVALAGDLKYGRTVHSLAEALQMFPDNQLYFVSPPELKAPCHLMTESCTEHRTLEEVIPEVDILYMTRIQRERFVDDTEYEHVRGTYRLTAEMLKKARPSMRVLHPLPRVDEIAVDVDNTPYAYYFQQAAGGVLVRKALLQLILGGRS